MNINQIRQDTKGCENQLFVNSAGASLPPKIVMETMLAYLQEEEMVGGYGLEAKRAADFSALYGELATLLNCGLHNTAFAYSATDAYSKVLSAIPFKMGDYILTTTNDYISNQISFLSLQKRFGIKLLRAKNLENGDVDLANFEALVHEYKPVLIAVTHVPTNSGLVQQAEEIGKIAKENNILYLLDACQSVGQLVVDVEKMNCDFLTATGRKFLRGPRTSGFLYVSDRILVTDLSPMFMDRRAAEWVGFDEYKLEKTGRRFESQEMSVAVLGLAAAVKYANQIGIENIYQYDQQLLNRLRANLLQIPNLRLLDKGTHLSNILTFNFSNRKMEEVRDLLNENKVVYSIAFKNFALIDFTEKEVEWAVRFSPHYYNTFEEMDKIAEILSRLG